MTTPDSSPTTITPQWLIDFRSDYGRGVSKTELGRRYYKIAEGEEPKSVEGARCWARRQIRDIETTRGDEFPFNDGTESVTAPILPRQFIQSSLYPSLHPAPFDTRTSETRDDVVDMDKDTLTVKVQTKNQINGEDDFIRIFNIDTSKWQSHRFECKSWEVTTKDIQKNPVVTVMYGSHAVFIRKKAVITARSEIEAMLAEARLAAPVYPKVLRGPVGDEKKLLELSCYDAHFGKLCWSPETADSDYDLQIAEALYLECVQTLIDRTRNHRFSECLFVVGNDGMNSEVTGDTTGGTRQDNDSRYAKIFRTKRRAIQAAVRLLRDVAPVRVVGVPGNHDRNAVFHLCEVLSAHYENCPDVTVDESLLPIKYHQFGKCMLMFTHGNEEKHSDLPLLMATDQPRMWGDTVYREAHVGHRHQTKKTTFTIDTDEFHGIRVRIIPALCPTDSWHRLRGYTMNLRGGEAFVWDAQAGLIDNVPFIVPPKQHFHIK